MNKWTLPNFDQEYQIPNRSEKDAILEDKEIHNDISEPNYVLIDAALWGDEIEEMFSMNISYRSLFRGSTGEELWSVAPYLIDIRKQDEFVEWLKKKDSEEKRVTWLNSFATIDELRKHLRRFLRAKTEYGDYMYFRFYDPYVVNIAFPNFANDQAKYFFETINYVVAEDHRLKEQSTYSFSEKQELEVKLKTID